MRKMCSGKEVYEIKMNNSRDVAEMKEMKEGERK
jgi:hypothetical protein